MKKLLSLFLIPAFFISICLLFSYFQQDEWHSFGTIQAYGVRYISLDKNFLNLIFFDRAGARVIMYLLFNLFHANALPFGLFSAAFHILNSLLVAAIAYKLTNKKNIAFLSSTFFLVNSVASQAYSWFGTAAGTLPSITFSLLSILFYLKFLERKKYSSAILSLIFIFIALLFKESAYSLFLIYPILWFLSTKKKSAALFIKENFMFILYGAFETFVFAQSILYIPGSRVNYVAASGNGFLSLIKHAVFYPIEGIGQIFFPPQFVYSTAGLFVHLFLPKIMPETSEFDIAYSTTMADLVSLLFVVLIAIFTFISYRRFKKNISRPYLMALVSSFSFLVLSFLPFVVINKSDAYLDSRYYYPSLVGASIFFSTLAVILIEHTKKYRKLVIGVIVFIFVSHFISLANDLINQVIVSQERINIVSSIKKEVPHLKNRQIFFVDGNSGGYYALPELKVPFQSGLGQVLMTVYGDPKISVLFKEQTLQKTLDGGFLYDTVAQGYKEANGMGFGYYYDKDLLNKEINLGKFSKSDVVFFFYDSDSKKIIEE